MKIAVDLQDNIESHNALLHEIKDTCLMLFDLWCERRGVIPLAYLMHCWPMPKPSVAVLTRLSASLADLARYHHDILGRDEQLAVRRVIHLVETAFGFTTAVSRVDIRCDAPLQRSSNWNLQISCSLPEARCLSCLPSRASVT
jgi:hypothetical protein